MEKVVASKVLCVRERKRERERENEREREKEKENGNAGNKMLQLLQIPIVIKNTWGICTILYQRVLLKGLIRFSIVVHYNTKTRNTITRKSLKRVNGKATNEQ